MIMVEYDANKLDKKLKYFNYNEKPIKKNNKKKKIIDNLSLREMYLYDNEEEDDKYA